MPVPKWVPALFSLLVAAHARAQAPVSVSLTTDSTPTPADAVYAIPTMPDRLGRVLAPINIDGHGPYRFLVDTGSTGTFVGAALAAELGIGPPADGSSHLLRIHDVLGTVTAPAIHLDRIDLGRFVTTDLMVPMLPLRDASGAVGVLGVERLQGRQLSVDFRRDIIRIEPTGRDIPDDYDMVAARIDKGGLMVISVEMDDISAPALIDTGAERTIINAAMLEALYAAGDNPLRIGDARLVNLFGTRVPGTFYVLEHLRLGPFSIVNLPIVVVAPQQFESWGHADNPAIVLGMDVLGRADGLVLDYGQSALYLRFPMTLVESDRMVRHALPHP